MYLGDITLRDVGHTATDAHPRVLLVAVIKVTSKSKLPFRYFVRVAQTVIAIYRVVFQEDHGGGPTIAAMARDRR